MTSPLAPPPTVPGKRLDAPKLGTTRVIASTDPAMASGYDREDAELLANAGMSEEGTA